MLFSLAPLYAAEEYSSNTKSPMGTMEPRDMYFPGTEKLALDEMRMILNRLVQAIENTPEIQWEYKTVVTTFKDRVAKPKTSVKVQNKKDLPMLNEHGKDGWELCCANNINLYITYFFKREIRE